MTEKKRCPKCGSEDVIFFVESDIIICPYCDGDDGIQ
jgi:ribosomal protein S27E